MGDTSLSFGDVDGGDWYNTGGGGAAAYTEPAPGQGYVAPTTAAYGQQYAAPTTTGYGQPGTTASAYGQSSPQQFGQISAAPPVQPNFSSFGGGPLPTGGGGGGIGGYGGFGDEEEPPLLEELGLNFRQLQTKTMSVLHPMTPNSPDILNETDLAGPLLFCGAFGATLLLSGRMEFGYIYGVAMLGSLGLCSVLNLMSEMPVQFLQVVSVLGYCLLPMVGLSSIAVFVSLKGIFGAILSLTSALWCAHSASKMFAAGLNMHDQQLLVAYPCFLFYGVFAMLTVF